MGLFTVCVQIALIILKVGGYIDWSWGLVLLPLWIVLGVALLWFVFMILVAKWVLK